MLKKLMKYSISTSILICLFLGFSLGYQLTDDRNPFPYENPNADRLSCDGNTDLGNCTSIKEDEDRLSGDKTIIRRLLGVFGLKDDEHEDLKFIDYAKAIVNMALGLISFIALIMTIYTFYMMFFSDSEAGIKKAKESLVGIFIALAVIGFAWLIVSFIFWWYKENLQKQEENIGIGNVAMIDSTIVDNQIYLSI